MNANNSFFLVLLFLLFVRCSELVHDSQTNKCDLKYIELKTDKHRNYPTNVSEIVCNLVEKFKLDTFNASAELNVDNIASKFNNYDYIQSCLLIGVRSEKIMIFINQYKVDTLLNINISRDLYQKEGVVFKYQEILKVTDNEYLDFYTYSYKNINTLKGFTDYVTSTYPKIIRVN